MKKTTHNVLILNGKQYDAITGALLGEANTMKRATPQPTAHQGRVVDGVLRMPRKDLPAAKIHQTTTVHGNVSRPKPSPKLKITHPDAAPIAPHKVQQSKTLMRSAVSKPTFTKKPAVKRQYPIQTMGDIAKPVVVPKTSVSEINPVRLSRAKTTDKSQAISRFGNPVRVAMPQPKTVQPALPSKPVPQPAPKDIFERALEQATAHQNKPLKKRGLGHHIKQQQSVLGIGLAMFLLVVIGGFIAYSNMPQIELKIASVHAGFQGALPSYRPIGFAKASDVRYGPSQISVSFYSADRQRNYAIVEQKSAWDSNALYENVVAASHTPYERFQQRGISIFIYGDSQAAWVNGGVLYQITGNAHLNNEELLKIASSV